MRKSDFSLLYIFRQDLVYSLKENLATLPRTQCCPIISGNV